MSVPFSYPQGLREKFPFQLCLFWNQFQLCTTHFQGTANGAWYENEGRYKCGGCIILWPQPVMLQRPANMCFLEVLKMAVTSNIWGKCIQANVIMTPPLHHAWTGTLWSMWKLRESLREDKGREWKKKNVWKQNKTSSGAIVFCRQVSRAIMCTLLQGNGRIWRRVHLFNRWRRTFLLWVV